MNLQNGSVNLIVGQTRNSKGNRMRWAKGCIVFIFFFGASLASAIGPNSPKLKPAHGSSQAAVPGHVSSTLKVGDRIPAFRAADQFGKERDFDNLKGPNGLVILFFRSADW